MNTLLAILKVTDARRHTGRWAEPPIALALETPSPPARNVNLPVKRRECWNFPARCTLQDSWILYHFKHLSQLVNSFS